MTDRTKKFVALYKSGKTLQEIGDLYGVSRERVRQVMWGLISADQGGRALKTAQRLQRLSVYRESQSKIKYGMTYQEYKENKRYLAPFRNQKGQARSRGIKWELTLSEWISVWEKSGKFSERGRGKNAYVMSRIGDSGPYALGNVQIKTSADNGREARAVACRQGPKNNFVGVYNLYPGRPNGWVAKYGDKTLGYFRSEQEAKLERDKYVLDVLGYVC